MASGKLFEFPKNGYQGQVFYAMEFMVSGKAQPFAVMFPVPSGLYGQAGPLAQVHMHVQKLLAEQFPDQLAVLCGMRELSREEAAQLIADHILRQHPEATPPNS